MISTQEKTNTIKKKNVARREDDEATDIALYVSQGFFPDSTIAPLSLHFDISKSNNNNKRSMAQ
jgi:hypothetical protein